MKARCAHCGAAATQDHKCSPTTRGGRPRIGTAVPISFTDEQRRWLVLKAAGLEESMSYVVRDLIDREMTRENRVKARKDTADR